MQDKQANSFWGTFSKNPATKLYFSSGRIKSSTFKNYAKYIRRTDVSFTASLTHMHLDTCLTALPHKHQHLY